ncbi:MAG TPA: hypothetical protein VFA18_01135 [Gemmataceae bacterium]|nr:hypothetical protein [Gemmataceae bacterium]
MSEPNGPPEFKVVLAQYLKERADQLHDAAEEYGLGNRFIEALKVIDDALRREPRAFGDPVFRLPALRLTVFIRAVFPLAVDYGVHDKLPLVIVRGFRLMI